MIKLVVAPARALDAAQLLARHPTVTDVRRSHSEPGLLYVYVDAANTTLPLIFALFQNHPDILIEQAEEYKPPFDDIFIQLMQQAEERAV